MICIYEGEASGNFGPLVDLRAIFELRCGCRTFLEKLRKLYPRTRFCLWVRAGLAELIKERYRDCALEEVVNGPALFLYAGAILLQRIPIKGEEEVFVAEGRTVGFRVKGNRVVRYRKGEVSVPDFPRREVRAYVVRYPWEIIRLNPEELARELTAEFPNRRLIRAPGSRVHSGVWFSFEKGPVFLSRGAEIRPGSFVEGPCYIGERTVIDGARVRPGCSFGPECRIGGEVEACVFQGYANKHHEGFLGHSFVGEWVNLGALTTGSDLKNNYRPVRVRIRGKRHDTGMLKLGCFIGDHVKTGIGTLLPTGAVLGTFANVFGVRAVPQEVGAFTWGGKARWREREMLDCARTVMGRRNCAMSPAYERHLVRLYRWRRK